MIKLKETQSYFCVLYTHTHTHTHTHLYIYTHIYIQTFYVIQGVLTIWSWQNGRWDYQQAWCKWCKTTVSRAHRLCASGIWERLSWAVSTWCQWTAGATVICRLPGLEDPHCTWSPHMACSVRLAVGWGSWAFWVCLSMGLIECVHDNI